MQQRTYKINNKGQSVLAEHVMVFFIVVAALVAMTTFVQRSFEARIHDARNFAIDSVRNACDANCLAATGNITTEYEPYYGQTLSYVTQNSTENQDAQRGSAQAIGAIYDKHENETTQTISGSSQLPPACAGPNPPAYCTGG